MGKPSTRSADELTDDQNARHIEPEAQDGLAHSLAKFGDLSCAWNRRNGKMISGNQRMDRLRAAGATTWEDHGDFGIVRHPTTGEVFRFRVVDWDEATHRAAQLAANNPETQGTFTDQAAEQLAALADAGLDMEVLRLDALAEMLAAREQAAPPPDPDAAPVWTPFAIEDIVSEAFRFYRETGLTFKTEPKHVWMQELNRIAQMSQESAAAFPGGGWIPDQFNGHRYQVKIPGKLLIADVFKNDEYLRHAIRWTLESGGKLSRVVPHNLAITRGAQVAANFRPAYAMYLYRKYCPENATILDTSAGFGGRLTGAFLSGRCVRYVGIDPNTKTQDGNAQLAAALGWSEHAELIVEPAEDVDAKKARIFGVCDVAFTSPPYFAKERYSDEPTQSWKRYGDGESWRVGFLEPVMALQFACLKPGCAAIVNIDDVTIGATKYPLVEWTIAAARAAGFIYEGNEVELALGSSDIKGESDESNEPVMVFRRPA